MPASYPTSVKTFAARNTGDVIQAAHVGDLQDEVNAIEDGLINGGAHLQSSNSTFAAVQVTGGTTFAGTVQISSGSTFSIRPVMPPPDAALIFLQSTGAQGSSADSTLSFLSDAYETNSSLHSTSANADRLTPQSTGIYLFGAQVAFSLPSVGNVTRRVLIQDSSGSGIGDCNLTVGSDTTAIAPTLQAFGTKRYDVTGGYAVVRSIISAGSTTSLSSGVSATWFSIQKL